MQKQRLKMFLIMIILLVIVLLAGVATVHSTKSSDYVFGQKLMELVESEPLDWKIPKTYKILFTSYNPERGQTDDSPCIGAGLTDVCQMYKRGLKPIALSQDLVGRAKWKPFTYGDKIMIVSDNPQCDGEWEVQDTMNKRYKMRGDLFHISRKDNTSCTGFIYKLNL